MISKLNGGTWDQKVEIISGKVTGPTASFQL